MQGSTEQQQITLISQLCGSITPDVWPGVESLELFAKLDLPKGQKRKVSSFVIVLMLMLAVKFLMVSYNHLFAISVYR